jgi:hypothetical protein
MGNGSRKRRIGSLSQLPNGKWYARITRGCKVDGQPRRLSKVFDTEQQADAWLMAKSVELGNDQHTGAGVTLSQVWAVWKQNRKGKVANKTYSTYAWLMEGAPNGKVSTWLDVMGGKDVTTITPQDVQRHLNGMPSQKARHAKAALSAVLTWAVRAGIIDTNPLIGHRFEYADDGRGIDFEDDPFAAIEQTRDVWGLKDVLKCFSMIRGLPLEPAWLACVGAGLRVEEALALRGMDVRRVKVGERMLTQLAIHAARTDMDERKSTKTRQSVRIVGMLEPMGTRYWEIAQSVARDELVCPVSAQNQNRRWRSYFAKPPKEWHKRMSEDRKVRGKLHKLRYVPLSKMRNTHVTIMAESGVSDSLNALMHGHTQMVERRHYLTPDMTDATLAASSRFKLVV